MRFQSPAQDERRFGAAGGAGLLRPRSSLDRQDPRSALPLSVQREKRQRVCRHSAQVRLGLVTGCRAQKDWALVNGAKQLNVHVNLGSVAETAGTQLDVLISFTIVLTANHPDYTKATPHQLNCMSDIDRNYKSVGTVFFNADGCSMSGEFGGDSLFGTVSYCWQNGTCAPKLPSQGWLLPQRPERQDKSSPPQSP
jgi:hypothetical protein